MNQRTHEEPSIEPASCHRGETRSSEPYVLICRNTRDRVTGAFDTASGFRPNCASPQNQRLRHAPPCFLPSDSSAMSSPLQSELITRLQRRSRFVSGIVVLCLVGQVVFPGVASFWLTNSDSIADGSAGGCCVVNLSAASGCCCGPGAGDGCGCACGKKQSATQKPHRDRLEHSESTRTIQSEICACGGKHRPGLITTQELAVLTEDASDSAPPAGSTVPESHRLSLPPRLTPPTPPPELQS